MKKRTVIISTDGAEFQAELNHSALADLILGSLPISSDVNIWGEEIYFTIPVKSDIKNPVESVEKGDIAYWPEGRAFCIFFGETPISSAGRIIPAGPVEIIGRVVSGTEELEGVRAGSRIKIENRGK